MVSGRRLLACAAVAAATSTVHADEFEGCATSICVAYMASQAADQAWATVALNHTLLSDMCSGQECPADYVTGADNWYREDSQLCCAVRHHFADPAAAATVQFVQSPLTAFSGATSNDVASKGAPAVSVIFPPGSAHLYSAMTFTPPPKSGAASQQLGSSPATHSFTGVGADLTLGWATDLPVWLRLRAACPADGTAGPPEPLDYDLTVGGKVVATAQVPKCGVSRAITRPFKLAASEQVVVKRRAGGALGAIDVAFLPIDASLHALQAPPSPLPAAREEKPGEAAALELLTCPEGTVVRNLRTVDTLNAKGTAMTAADRPAFEGVFVTLRPEGARVSSLTMTGLFQAHADHVFLDVFAGNNFSTSSVLHVRQATGAGLERVASKVLSAECAVPQCGVDTKQMMAVNPDTGAWELGQPWGGAELGERIDGSECEWTVECPAGTAAVLVNTSYSSADAFWSTSPALTPLPPSGTAGVPALPVLVPYTAPLGFVFDNKRSFDAVWGFPAAWGFPGTPVNLAAPGESATMYSLDRTQRNTFAVTARCSPSAVCSSAQHAMLAATADAPVVIRSDLDGEGPAPYPTTDDCAWKVTCPAGHKAAVKRVVAAVGAETVFTQEGGAAIPPAGYAFGSQDVSIVFKGGAATDATPAAGGSGFTLEIECVGASVPLPVLPSGATMPPGGYTAAPGASNSSAAARSGAAAGVAEKKSHAGPIIGAVIGALLLFALLAVLAFFVARRRRQQQQEAEVLKGPKDRSAAYRWTDNLMEVVGDVEAHGVGKDRADHDDESLEEMLPVVPKQESDLSHSGAVPSTPGMVGHAQQPPKKNDEFSDDSDSLMDEL